MGIPVNGKMLRWARETSGYSVEDVAQKMGKDAIVVQEWEEGKKYPPYGQLERLAYTIYKRPIALFFFPEPPDESDIKSSFRTLPDSELANIPPRVHFLRRKAQVFQFNMAEMFDGINPASEMITRDLGFSPTDDVAIRGNEVREYLGVSLREQKTWTNNKNALKEWRNALEKKGILVFKDSFSEKDPISKEKKDNPYSGFCLYDNEFPLVYVNNNHPPARQIFTLFHELAHLLLSVGGVDKRGGDEYVAELSGDDKNIEILCNKFAGEFLIPSDSINSYLEDLGSDAVNDENIFQIAKQYCVSREVILRRIIDLNIVENAVYEKKVAEWRAKSQSQSSKKGGGDYYNTLATYISKTYMERVFSQYYQQRITPDQARDYLNIKSTTTFEKFEDVVVPRFAT